MADLPGLVDRLRASVAADQPFAVDALLELVAISSVAPAEQMAQERFASLARSSDLEVEAVPIPVEELVAHPRHVATELSYVDRPTVVARLPGGSAGSIMLNSHIDTVRLADGWIHDPTGQLVGTRIYGLGSADAKGGLVAALVALRALGQLRVPLPGDVVIQSVIDEEGSGNGTLAALLSATPADCRIAIVLEPTDLAVAYGHRGMLAFDLACPGKSAHGATGGGVNAITSAARVVLALEELGSSLGGLVEAGYLPPRLNVGMIEGGREVYTTADRCLVRFSVRYAPHQRDEVLGRVHAAVGALAGASDPEYAPRIVAMADHDAAETAPDRGLPQKFVAAARTVRPATALTTLAGTCDARHFRNLAGIPSLIFGPGRLEDAHAAEEHVEVADILDAAIVLATFAASA